MARRKTKIATQAVGSIPAREGDDLTEQTNFDEVKNFAKSFFKNGIMPLASHEVQAQKDKAAKILDDKRLLRNMKARTRRRNKARLAREAALENAPKPKTVKPKPAPKKRQPRFKVRSQAQRKARRGRKS